MCTLWKCKSTPTLLTFRIKKYLLISKFWHCTGVQFNVVTIVFHIRNKNNKLCAWRHNMPSPLQVDNIFAFIRQVAPVPGGYLRHQQQVDLLTLKVVSESHVTWATSVPILVFLGLSVLELGPMYATDRQTSDRQTDVRRHVRQKHRLMPPPYGGGRIIILSLDRRILYVTQMSIFYVMHCNLILST